MSECINSDISGRIIIRRMWHISTHLFLFIKWIRHKSLWSAYQTIDSKPAVPSTHIRRHCRQKDEEIVIILHIPVPGFCHLLDFLIPFFTGEWILSSFLHCYHIGWKGVSIYDGAC